MYTSGKKLLRVEINDLDLEL